MHSFLNLFLLIKQEVPWRYRTWQLSTLNTIERIKRKLLKIALYCVNIQICDEFDWNVLNSFKISIRRLFSVYKFSSYK